MSKRRAGGNDAHPDADDKKKARSGDALPAAAPAATPAALPVSVEELFRANLRIQSGIVKSSLEYAEVLSEMCGMEIHLKYEIAQRTGSFKERGARNRLMLLSPEEKKRGVVAASAGNHALALAYHGKLLGIPVTVCMPVNAPITKTANCAKMGANVVLHGEHLEEARTKALEFMNDKQMVYVNGFDDPAIIAGAGSIGLEVIEQLKDVDAIVVPVGGGGLIAGIALAVKALREDVLVIGVEAANCPSFSVAMARGEPTQVEVAPSLADGLAVCKVGGNAFQICKRYVDKVVTVNEKEVALAVLKMVELQRSVVEGAGACGIAALLAGKLPELKGKKVVTPLCGGNIDPGVLGTVIQRGMAEDGRLLRFQAAVSDKPGGLCGLLSVIAREGGSVKDVHHDRAFLSEPQMVSVTVVIETRGIEHCNHIKKVLRELKHVYVTLPSRTNLDLDPSS